MASKDNQSKTSKTARVMNLLSKKPENAPASEGTQPAAAAPVPPIISSIAPDAEAAAQIKNALEDELAGELGAAPAAAASPEPAQPAPEPVRAEAAPEQPKAEPVTAEAAPASHEPEPGAPAPSASGQDEAPRFVDPVDPGYINVMQVLVEEKAPKYIEMFGLCTCKRCLEDVKALTLNHLPPKYVVLADGDRVPRLTVYEGRYSSDITAQLLKSCHAVMERPHHAR